MSADYVNKYLTEEGFDFPRLLNDDFFQPIHLLYNCQHFASATKLLMNFIDTIGFIEFGDTGENTFVKWLSTYADLTVIDVTGEELWEHRNSLLHMSNLDSREVIAGKVRRLAWLVGKAAPPSMDTLEYKFYNLFEFMKILANACSQWCDSFNRDASKFSIFVDRYDLIVSDGRPGMVEIRGDGEAK
jgi:hypothetical protein